MTSTQANFDRNAEEFNRLVNTPLPDGWLELCMNTGFPGLVEGMSLEHAQRIVHAIVNTILPLHERLLRQQIAKEVRYGGPTRVT